jgi:hypothetical protein
LQVMKSWILAKFSFLRCNFCCRRSKVKKLLPLVQSVSSKGSFVQSPGSTDTGAIDTVPLILCHRCCAIDTVP